MTSRRALPLALALVLLVGGACSDSGDSDNGDGGEEATGTTSSSTTPSSSGSSTSSIPPPPPEETGTTVTTIAGAEDWDGARYDAGRVDRIDRTEDGRTLVVFDRAQVYNGREWVDGPRLEEEPIIYGNTGVEMINENPRLRTYVFHPQGEILFLANIDKLCENSSYPSDEAPRWEKITVDKAVDESIWTDWGQDALTFDPSGRVIRIRFSGGC